MTKYKNNVLDFEAMRQKKMSQLSDPMGKLFRENSDDDWDYEFGDDVDDDFDDAAEETVRLHWRSVCEKSSFTIPALVNDKNWYYDADHFSKRGIPAQSEPVPSKLQDVLPWIVRNDLTSDVTIYLRTLQQWANFSLRYYKGGERLIDVLQTEINDRKSFGLRRDPHFMRAVSSYLNYLMQRKQWSRHRKKMWKLSKVESSAVKLAQNAMQLLEEFGNFSRVNEPFLFRSVKLLVPVRIRGFGVQFELNDSNPYINERSINTVIHILPTETYGIDCTCGQIDDYPCSHIRIMLEWLLDVLCDAEDPAHAPLTERLNMPSWKMGLVQLKRNVDILRKPVQNDAKVSTRERIAWRINEPQNRSKALLEPIVQTLGKNGKWSKGKRITERTWFDRYSERFERSEPIVSEYWNVLDSASFDDASIVSEKIANMVIQLAEHPHVFFGDKPAQPIKVIKEKVVFSVSPGERGTALGLRVGNATYFGEEILAHMLSQVHLYELDLDQGRFFVGTISNKTRAFAVYCVHTASHVPEEAIGELVQLMAYADGADIWVHPALRGRTVAADSCITVRVVPQDDIEIELSFVVYPMNGLDALIPGEGPRELIRQQDGNRIYVDRDFEKELTAANQLVEDLHLPSTPVKPFNWSINDLQTSLEVLSRLSDRNDVTVEWPEGSKPLRVLRATTPRLQMSARQKQDWFFIGGDVTIGETKVSLKQLLTAVRKKDRFVRLKNGDFLVLEKALYEQLSVLGGLGADAKQGEISVPKSRVPFMDEQLKTLSFCGGKQWDNIKERMEKAHVLSPRLPKSFKGTLRPYQKEGFLWLCKLSHWAGGACLADDMGLGKTIQVLAFLLWRKRKQPSLVVSPMSVCHNWIKEALGFAPSLDVRLFHGANRQESLQGTTANSVVVTSYDTLTANIEVFSQLEWEIIVLDEAQMIKNALSKRSRAVAELNAGFRIALTGTPVENHLGDLWSIFHGAAPGLLGTYEQFRRQYAIPIERDANPKAKALLVSLIGPFLLRRTKAAVLPDLPPRIETIRQIELYDEHRKLYDEERKHIVAQLLDTQTPSSKKRFAALAGLTKLRRLACHPRLVDEHAVEKSAKMEQVTGVVQDLVAQQQRALIFSQFTSHLALLQKELLRLGIGYLYLDGSTPATKRKELVERWHTNAEPLFVISLKAGGTGLNLTGADYVLHLDPWWNPAAEDQATDRTHRIGQEKTVTVVRFISSETVEQGVVALHEQKRELADAILEGAATHKKLSPDELIALIRGQG